MEIAHEASTGSRRPGGAATAGVWLRPTPRSSNTGRALFNDPKLSGSGQLSCATCHPMNGHTDNKTYVVAEVVADGDPKGRSTPTLWGAGIRQAEWSWAGNIPSIETNIRGIIVNRMKGAEPSKETLDALAAYVKSLPNGPAPFLNADGMPRDNAPGRRQARLRAVLGQGGLHDLPRARLLRQEGAGGRGQRRPVQGALAAQRVEDRPLVPRRPLQDPRRNGHLHVGLLQEEERQQGQRSPTPTSATSWPSCARSGT